MCVYVWFILIGLRKCNVVNWKQNTTHVSLFFKQTHPSKRKSKKTIALAIQKKNREKPIQKYNSTAHTTTIVLYSVYVLVFLCFVSACWAVKSNILHNQLYDVKLRMKQLSKQMILSFLCVFDVFFTKISVSKLDYSIMFLHPD